MESPGVLLVVVVPVWLRDVWGWLGMLHKRLSSWVLLAV